MHKVALISCPSYPQKWAKEGEEKARQFVPNIDAVDYMVMQSAASCSSVTILKPTPRHPGGQSSTSNQPAVPLSGTVLTLFPWELISIFSQ